MPRVIDFMVAKLVQGQEECVKVGLPAVSRWLCSLIIGRRDVLLVNGAIHGHFWWCVHVHVNLVCVCVRMEAIFSVTKVNLHPGLFWKIAHEVKPRVSTTTQNGVALRVGGVLDWCEGDTSRRSSATVTA